MSKLFETELEKDGRWIAEVPKIAGVMAYGNTELEAIKNTLALALRVLTERLKYRELHSQI
jgi:predicted RNase H-like HicB family nuclease